MSIVKYAKGPNSNTENYCTMSVEIKVVTKLASGKKGRELAGRIFLWRRAKPRGHRSIGWSKGLMQERSGQNHSVKKPEFYIRT